MLTPPPPPPPLAREGEGEGEEATMAAPLLSVRLALVEERGVWEGEGDMET